MKGEGLRGTTSAQEALVGLRRLLPGWFQEARDDSHDVSRQCDDLGVARFGESSIVFHELLTEQVRASLRTILESFTNLRT